MCAKLQNQSQSHEPEAARVLLVEESPTQALAFQDLLERGGFRVEHVRSPSAALQSIEENVPDLAILDFRGSGTIEDQQYELLRRVSGADEMRVLVLAAGETEIARLRELDLHADGFLPRSAEPELFLARARSLTNGTGPRPSRAPLASTSRPRVLTIDDSPTYLEFLRGELEAEGYEVHQADTGKEGLRRLGFGGFDCVLVDRVMPGVDGMEVCRRINEWRQATGSSLAVLMLTGKEGTEDLTQALEAGADDFVGKSLERAVIRSRVRALLRRKFHEDEHRRLQEELRLKELEARQAETERAALEARASLVDELEKTSAALRLSNEELERYAYAASHDLQEPLRILGNFCQLLERRCAGKLEPKAEQYLHYIVGAARRMRQLIDDLLELSRLAEPEEFRTVETGALLESVLERLAPKIEGARAAVAYGELPAVMGDEAQLARLFLSLIDNALEFRGENTPEIQVAAEEREDECVFSIRDNGIGFSPEYAEQIFVVFQRLGRRKEHSGNGIGLALCKKIVRTHRGRIWVESEPGKGSTFHFSIPRHGGKPQ